MIVDLQLPIQSVPITTYVVSLNLDHYVIKFVTGRWFSLGPPVSSTNKTDLHDIADILLKGALDTIKQTNKHKPYHYETYSVE
jgi:hypothetical protein